MAFDKVLHEGLFYSLERIGLDPKTQRLVQAVYSSPSFRVSLNGRLSNVYEQKSGIRQGCPLSPYLFLI
eukprot:9275080-Prorocentrum_lima.AAC.1